MPTIVEIPFTEIVTTFKEYGKFVTLSDFVIIRVINHINTLHIQHNRLFAGLFVWLHWKSNSIRIKKVFHMRIQHLR